MATRTDLPSRTDVNTTQLRATELVSEQGRTTIADAVVAKIAGMSAREVPGVHRLVPRSVGSTVAGLAQRVVGAESPTQGVSVQVGQREAVVDLSFIVEYGVSIPQVADAVRNNIVNRVQSMTGLTVREVNIDVTDLFFPGEEAEQTAQRRGE
jgi:uncharacterized alkaline shock family protein YloU